jgi:hypothetical protein
MSPVIIGHQAAILDGGQADIVLAVGRLVRHAIFSGGGIAGYDRSGIDQPLGFFHVARFYSGEVVLILLGWLRMTE